MKKQICLLLAMIAFIAFADAEKLKEYHINVGQFDKVSVTDNVNVVYQNREDSSGYINYTCPQRLADCVLVSVDKGKLKIQIQTEEVNRHDLPTLYIYSDFLTSIENSSDSLFRVKSISPCANLNVKQIGNGSISVDDIKSTEVKAALATGRGLITLSGKCRKAVLIMVGTGTIQSDLLESETVHCKILGSGTIGCYPVSSLKVSGLGSTKIYYRGNPVIKKSGGGKLLPLTDSNYGTIIE